MAIQLTLRFQSPLNIGSGLQQGTIAKQPLLKNRQGWPYVPASTLKGRLRHACERVANAAELPVCVTHQEMCRPPQAACVVCQLFGAPWYEGSGRFHDLVLSGPADILRYKADLQQTRIPHPPTTIRHGVAINRRRGTAENNMLYTTELLLSGVPLEFSGHIAGPITIAQRALLEAGLNELFSLGRAKSRGLGWFTVAIDRSDNDPTPAELKAALMAQIKAEEKS